MKIEVSGNVNFSLENETPEYRNYFIEGSWGYNYLQNEIYWVADAKTLGKINGTQLVQMCKEIQGCEYPEILQIFKRYNVHPAKQNPSIQELDLIKAIINIFLWVDYLLHDDYDPSDDVLGLPKLYDDFKIDINNKSAPQREIYFLKKEYSEPIYVNEIQNLIDINLLDSFRVVTKASEFTGYFMPLTKPGYRRDVFQDEPTFQLWHTLLKDRHSALTNYFKQNRFYT